MKKTMKRIAALMMAVIMTVGLLTTNAFAVSSAESDVPNYDYYVPMGTSITGGYGITTSRWGGAAIVGSFGKGAYAGLVADYFDIDGHYDGALLGTRAHEYRVLLEEDFHGDDYTEGWAQAKCGNGEEHLKAIAPEYKEALAKSDLITLEIGSNDVFGTLLYKMQGYLDENADVEDEEQLDEDLEDLSDRPTGVALAGMMAIAKELGLYDETRAFMLEVTNQAMSDFRTNFDAVVADVREINPTADMVVLSVYNPMPYLLNNDITNNANGSQDVKNLILQSGEELEISEEDSIFLASTLSTMVVNLMNTHISQTSSQASKYVYADVTGIDLTGSADGTHPSYAGHAYLAEHVETAVLSLYDCQHLHQTTEGAVVPTASSSGSTGRIVCAECGTVLQESRTITYAEYLAQQEIGEFEDSDVVIDPETGEIVYPEVDYSVLAFTSDIHNKSDNKSAKRLSSWLVAAQSKEGAFDFFGSCGDTADAQVSESNYWNYADKVFDVLKDSNIKNYAFTTGNHEHSPGNYTSTTNAIAKNVKDFGEATVRAGANYRVFCFGAAQSSSNFPSDRITQLNNYLASVNPNTPVFILSHFPLHNTNSRSVQNKDAVIEVLNKYPNVIFLWGHNHTDANSAEKHYDNVYTGSLDGTAINFTYAAAGCMSDSEYGGGSGAVSGKGLIVTVSKDATPEVTMMYTDANGQLVTAPVSIDITGNKTPSASKERIQGSYSFESATPQEDQQYVIVSQNNGKNVAMDTTYCGGYTNGNNYKYSGFKGAEVTVQNGRVVGNVTNDMVWKFESAGNNQFRIKNVLTGTYLNSTYEGSPATGILKSDSVTDIWTLSGNQLKSTNSTKSLAFDTASTVDGSYTGEVDFFTIRSKGTDFTFYKVPAGLVKEAEPVQGGTMTNLAKVNSPEAGKNFVIVCNGIALDTNPNTGYLNDTGYAYSGFTGKKVTINRDGKLNNADITKNMVWTFEKSGDGFQIKNAYTGEYLSSTYESNTTGGKTGTLFLAAQSDDVWTVDGTTYTSKNSKKCLAYDSQSTVTTGYTGNLDFFTIRTKGTTINLYYVEDVNTVGEPTQSDVAGECSHWAMTRISEDTYGIIINGNAIGVDGERLIAQKIDDPTTVGQMGDAFLWKITTSAKNSDLWNICSMANKMYLSIYVTSSLATTTGVSPILSTQPHDWSFDNGFSTDVEVKAVLGLTTTTTTYYLTSIGSAVTISNRTVNNTAKLYRKVVGGEHNMVVDQSATTATCLKAGTVTYTCSVCGKVLTETNAYAPHNYSRWEVQPTCTEAGYYAYTCSVCGRNAEQNTPSGKAALGHVDANRDNLCDRCGVSYTDPNRIDSVTVSVSKSSVNPGDTVACTATVTGTNQNKAVTWSVENANSSNTRIASNGNLTVGSNETASTIVVKATSVADSTKSGTQTISVQVNVPCTHNYTSVVILAPTCVATGTTRYTCSICGDTYTSTIPTVAHTYETVVTAPTTTAEGYTTHTCSVCGDSYKDNYVAPIVVPVVTELDTPVIKMTRVSGTTSSGTDYFGKAKISWSAIDGAAKYEVWRATELDGEYKLMGSTTKTSYTNSGAPSGTTFYYKVRAVAADGSYSAYSDVKTFTTSCDAPVVTMTRVSGTTSSGTKYFGKAKLSWDAVTGAEKYEVYRATSKDGEYSLMGTTTKTSFTNSGAPSGKTFYYKVKAISGASSYAHSDFSTIKSFTTACDAPVVTLTRVSGTTSSGTKYTGKAKLSWSAVTGAEKYEIYRATEKDGEYKLLGSTTKTSYSNSGAPSGTTYYYKVKAISALSKYANSDFSTIKTFTTSCNAPVVSIKLSSGHPKLTWSAITGAEKYEVYRATSKDGTYSLMGTTANTSFTNSGAPGGKTYYYKVKAISADSKYANSAYSTVVSIKAQ